MYCRQCGCNPSKHREIQCYHGCFQASSYCYDLSCMIKCALILWRVLSKGGLLIPHGPKKNAKYIHMASHCHIGMVARFMTRFPFPCISTNSVKISRQVKRKFHSFGCLSRVPEDSSILQESYQAYQANQYHLLTTTLFQI